MLYRTLCILLTVVCFSLSIHASERALTPLERLGKHIFFDQTLSEPSGQSCASCHAPETGWTGDRSEINAHQGVYPGAVEARSGNRKPPSAAYANFSPVLHYDNGEGLFIGGSFWDGRATGWLLGDPIAEQAQGPFLNPVEQNVSNAKRMVALVCHSPYHSQLLAIYGNGICDTTVSAYNAIAKAISAYEASPEVNAFTSKYDYYLASPKRYPLNKQEMLGLAIFEDPNKGNCVACHPNLPAQDGTPPLFTDFSYDNLGFPKNKENSWYQMPAMINPDGDKWIDLGLGGFLASVPRFASYSNENIGKHKVPTLRNVDLRPHTGFVKAYGHNGYFKSLKEIVHFYNTRDVKPHCREPRMLNEGDNCWPLAEVASNVNREELGNLGLNDTEERALVAFMMTLSDHWTPPTN